MSATNSTTNYALPIFIGSDKPAWLVDWNGAMTAIDAAIKGVDTDVQGAIVDISGLSSTVASHTSSISTISGQITVITTNLNTATGNINTINSLIGNGTPTTTDQTLIGAINELHANQGDLADLTTPAASLVAAINAISSGGAVAASAVSFDNTGTSIVATNVQAAIVELSQGGAVTPSAEDVSYDNTASGLTATDVQDAIDEVAASIKDWTLVPDPTTALPADYTECYVFVTGTGAPASFVTFVKDAVSGLSDIGIVNGGYMSANYSWSLTVHVMNSGEKIGAISLYNNGTQVSNPTMKVYVR